MQHKHYALIIQWAANPHIKLQFYFQEAWRDLVCAPTWNEGFEYRVKPEPKPNVVVTRRVVTNNVSTAKHFTIRPCDVGPHHTVHGDIKLEFDGETGGLVHVEIL